MKIIFEDSSESPISKLLLGSSVGKDMIFYSGSRRIPRVIKQVLRTDELVVLYVDVSPNNESTVETYRHAFRLAKQNCRILLVPIICAEYVLLRMLVHYGYITELCSKDRKLYDFIDRYVLCNSESSRYEKESLEKICKHVVEKHLPECLQNKKHRPGKFLCGNCECDECTLSNRGYTDGFTEKAERECMHHCLYSWCLMIGSTAK